MHPSPVGKVDDAISRQMLLNLGRVKTDCQKCYDEYLSNKCTDLLQIWRDCSLCVNVLFWLKKLNFEDRWVILFKGLSKARCPITWHRTVNARTRSLLVYEGNESHVIKNMAATVKFILWFSGLQLYSVAVYSVPCDQSFSSISFIVRCRAIRQRARCSDSHDLKECHHLYDLGRHIYSSPKVI